VDPNALRRPVIVTPARVLHLQGSVGNQSVMRWLARRGLARQGGQVGQVSRFPGGGGTSVDALRTGFTFALNFVFNPGAESRADIRRVTAGAARRLGLTPEQIALASEAAGHITNLTGRVNISGAEREYDLQSALVQLHKLLNPAPGAGLPPVSGALGVDFMAKRVIQHGSEFVSLAVYEDMMAADPTLEVAEGSSEDSSISLQGDLERILAALGNTHSLYMLELEAAVDQLVALRREAVGLSDRAALAANAQERSELARRALLINNELLHVAGDQAAQTALDVTVAARLGEINALARTEAGARAELGDTEALLAPQPLPDRLREDQYFAESGLAEERESRRIEPEEAFPEQTDRFMTDAQRTLTERVRTQAEALELQLDSLAPPADQATYELPEFRRVYQHWYSLFSREQELSNEVLRDSLQFWQDFHQMTGMATTKAYGDVGLGAIRIMAMEKSFDLIGLNVSTGIVNDFQSLVNRERLERRDELTGRGASDAGYETAELYGNERARTYGGEVSSRGNLLSQRSGETAGQYSRLAGLPFPLQAPFAAGQGLLKTLAPIKGLRKVEAREGWSFLVTIRDDSSGNVTGYEHKVATPEAAEFLLAYRQHQGTQELPHTQFTQVLGQPARGGVREQPAPIGRGSGLIRPLEEGRVPRTSAAPRPDQRVPTGTDVLQQRLLAYLNAFFQQEDPAPRVMGLFLLMDIEHNTGAVLSEMIDPGEIAKVLAQATATGFGLSALSQMGPIGQALSQGLNVALKMGGGNDVAAAMSVAKFFEMALSSRSFHGARTLGYMGVNIVQDIRQVFETILSEPAGRVGGAAGRGAVEGIRRRLANQPPETIAQAAEIARALGEADPAAREAIKSAVDEMISERRASGQQSESNVELDVLIAFRGALEQRSEAGQRLDPFTTPITGHGRTSSELPLMGGGFGVRSPAEVAQLHNALGPLRGQVDIIEDPSLNSPDLARTVRVYYLGKRVRVHVGPQAVADDIRLHLQTIRNVQRYQGLRGRLRLLLDDVLIAIGAKSEAERHGSEGAEARAEIEKLGAIRDELTAIERTLQTGQAEARDGRLSAAEIARQIAEIDGQIVEHARNFASTDAGRGFIAATRSGVVHIDPQTAHVAVSRPELLARYEGLATRKLPQIVAEVLSRQGSTPPRRRLDALHRRFETLRNGIPVDRVELTPAERARASAILQEARDLARKDFNNLRKAVWNRLRSDPELRALAAQMQAAGDVELERRTGRVHVRVRTETETGDIVFRPLDLEHRGRLSDNPWRYNDPENLIVTDAPLNQQYLEALRRYGGIWGTEETEAFITRHNLTEQTSGYGPPGTQEHSAQRSE
jgi:hypothetical protein